MPHVLVKVRSGYGLGDNVQMSVVLKHLRRYRPTWTVDFLTDRGRHKVGIGLCNRVWTYDDPPTGKYDAAVMVSLYDNFANWTDRPGTRTTSCLHESFGLDWDRELGRYEIHVSDEAWQRAHDVLRGTKAVGIHWQGVSDPARKNLTRAQVQAVCRTVTDLGRVPVIFDKDKPEEMSGAFCAYRGMIDGGDAEDLAALIHQCRAFVGIDSGPAHVACATGTPALVIWTGHHPLQYMDPAPNVAHLVPVDHREMEPVRRQPACADWFEKNYRWRAYRPGGMAEEVGRWLGEVAGGGAGVMWTMANKVIQ